MIIQEVLFLSNEPVSISDDVYALTIAANMTKTCSPMSLQFGIRQCIFVFCVQIIVAFFFAYEALPLNGFLIERFNLSHTIMRIVCSIFLQMTLNKELKNTLKMLTYLKNQRGNSKNLKGRYINYTLCFMQKITPMISQVMFSI